MPKITLRGVIRRIFSSTATAISWFGGLVFILIGIAGGGIGGFIFAIVGALLLPPIRRKTATEYDIEFSRGFLIAMVVIALISGLVVPWDGDGDAEDGESENSGGEQATSGPSTPTTEPTPDLVEDTPEPVNTVSDINSGGGVDCSNIQPIINPGTTTVFVSIGNQGDIAKSVTIQITTAEDSVTKTVEVSSYESKDLQISVETVEDLEWELKDCKRV